MVDRKELRKLSQQQSLEAYNQQKQQKEESQVTPTQAFLGARDPSTGKDTISYANGGKAAGIRTFSASAAYGTPVRSLQPYGSSIVAIDNTSYIPSTEQIPEQVFVPPSKFVFGLLASTNNYINGEGEAPIMAALIAQLFQDVDTWTVPKRKVKKRLIACLIGPTYTPLEPIREALEAYGYSCEDVPDTKKGTIAKYDALIARVVQVGRTQPNYADPFLLGEQLEGIKYMLENKKFVYLGGCGCPYGSYPLNDVLKRLGTTWSVQTTRPLPEESKPKITYPWIVQKNSKFKTTQSYVPEITDRTVFSGTKSEEEIVKSANGKVMMAYSPYPDCIKWKRA